MGGHHTTDVSRVHINRKEYWIIFSLLAVLTALEVGMVFIPGISKGLLIFGLILFAFVKAGLVGMFFMHLNHESKAFKSGVIGSLMVPFFYAAVLILDALWRLVW